MINLLPYENKKQIRAGRMNIILIRFIVILGMAMGFLVLACGASYLVLNVIKDSDRQVVTVKAKTKSTNSIQQQADAFRNNLINVKSMLDNEITYSDVLSGLGATLPKGAILDSLSLNETSFSTTYSLTILAKSNDQLQQIDNNFKSSQYFSNYKLVTSSATPDGSTDYPVKISTSITINRRVSQ